jgi:hypothetical protein
VASETLTWLQEFVEAGGLGHLFTLLGKTIDRGSNRSRATQTPAQMKLTEENLKLQMEIIKCMTHILNNKACKRSYEVSNCTIGGNHGRYQH